MFFIKHNLCYKISIKVYKFYFEFKYNYIFETYSKKFKIMSSILKHQSNFFDSMFKQSFYASSIFYGFLYTKINLVTFFLFRLLKLLIKKSECID